MVKRPCLGRLGCFADMLGPVLPKYGSGIYEGALSGGNPILVSNRKGRVGYKKAEQNRSASLGLLSLQNGFVIPYFQGIDLILRIGTIDGNMF